MTTNKTVNQVITANPSLQKQLKVTTTDSSVSIHGTAAALRMLAEILLATAGGGGNTSSQGFKAQLAKTERSGFVLTSDSVERIAIFCDDSPVTDQTD